MNIGVYIQVPFCQTKCTYCNFHTGVAARSMYAPYARAVVREISEYRAFYAAAGLPVTAAESGGAPNAGSDEADTVYLGGGTPSLLDAADLGCILDAVRAAFTCNAAEITLEADPETITDANAAAWQLARINRISLGVQSLNDAELIAAGRMHRASDVDRAVQMLRSAGLGNISIDLIAGLPHQTPATWRESVDAVLGIRPEHISIYLLEIDDGSRLGRESLAGGQRYGAAQIPGDDAMAESYEHACERLSSAGYEHYEISNWALPGRHSRHNLKYWRREPYLGFGAGAHSFYGAVRWANAHDPAYYAAAIAAGRLPVEQRDAITPQQALDEEMFLGLRQLAGIDIGRIEKQYGVNLASRFSPLFAQGLVEREGPRVRLAPSRLTVSNEVFVALLGNAQ